MTVHCYFLFNPLKIFQCIFNRRRFLLRTLWLPAVFRLWSASVDILLGKHLFVELCVQFLVCHLISPPLTIEKVGCSFAEKHPAM
ncbi:hypothetical protein GCWU000341_00492 [Oribacterium sp. oral taxon 078 str. F0262]|nr:hypothetical protein GCWU000341_00492 [Oribacterium sp. oral taxon 078 str. F0262]